MSECFRALIVLSLCANSVVDPSMTCMISDEETKAGTPGTHLPFSP